MADKFRTHHIILVISSRRGIISVAIGGSGSRGTDFVAIHIVIIVVFRSSTRVVMIVTVGIIIVVVFGFVVIITFSFLDDAAAIMDTTIVVSFIVGFAFGCRVIRASGWGTVIIHLEKGMMMVAFEIIIDVVFGIVIAVIVVVVVVVNGEGPTLNPAVRIIIVGVSDEAKGPIISGVRGLDTAVGTIIV